MKHVAYLVAALSIASPAAAQRARLPEPLSLDDAMRIAQRHRPEVGAARARAGAAEQRPAIVSVPDDPMLMLDLMHVPVEQPQFMGGDFGIGAQMTVPLGDVLGSRARAARAEARGQRRDAERVGLDVALDAAMAFLELYLARSMVGLIDAQLALAQQIEASANARYSAGLGTQAEALRAEAEVARLRAERAALDGRVDGAEAMLRAALGLRPETHVPVLGTLMDDARLPLAQRAALARAQRARPELAARRARVERGQAETEAMEGMYWPMLTVRLGGAYTMADGAGVMGSVGISIPIFRDRLDAGVREARLMTEMAEEELTAMQRLIEGQVGAAIGEVRAARARRDALVSDVVPRAMATVDASLAQYAAGRVPQVMAIESLRVAFDLQISALRAEVEAAMAQARLARVLGEPGGTR
ncbi:MAG: TolC family protein [Sandaracinaceae bacterium]|nr:TolC family protein [Sandaracinaceae bacterium]